MIVLLEGSPPIVGAAAGFHCNRNTWVLGEQGSELLATDGTVEDFLSLGIDAANLESILCQINGD
jgi:hypothetical protein